MRIMEGSSPSDFPTRGKQVSASIPEDWKLPESLLMQLGVLSGRQKCLNDEGHLCLVMHEPPSGEGSTRQRVLAWLAPEGETWKFSSSKRIAPSFDTLLSAYEQHVDELEDTIDELEDPSLESLHSFLRSLAPLSRSLKNLSVVLDQAVVHCDDQRSLLESAEKAHALIRQCELMQFELQNDLQLRTHLNLEAQSRHQEEIAAAGRRLNLVVATFLPLTAVASVFGMNLLSGYEELPQPFFWLIVLGAVAAGFGLSRFVSKGKNR
jgi:Mg2+ and Co2+ transporter CorA